VSKKGDRQAFLLGKAAEALDNGADPFSHEFLLKEQVTADECIGLSQMMATILKGWLACDGDDRTMVIALGAIYGESPAIVEHFRNSLKVSTSLKKIKALAK